MQWQADDKQGAVETLEEIIDIVNSYDYLPY
jgi:hypothetical protein